MLPSPRNSVKAFRSRLQEAPRLPVVDRAVQKEELNKIFRDLQTAGLRESPKFARRLLEFLENIVKERGVALHDILGQHVANNVIFTVMECVLLPSLREFSDLVARRQPLAGGRGAHSTTKNSENHLEVRAKKIRTDVVRPWRALVDTVHRNLPPSLKLQHVSGLPSSLSSSLAGPSGSTRDAVANVNSVVGGVAGLEANSFRRPVDSMERTFTNEDTPQFQATGGKEENFNCFRHMWTSAPNHTYLPLLWKNAVPFNTVVQHILWVLQTETLSSMFGQDFAHILLQLLSFRGYLSNLHPRFIRQLAMRLLLLVERTAYESYAVNSNTSGMSKLEVNQSVGDGEANLPGGSEDDGVPSPSVDEGTTYAALLAQLFRAPHLLSALTPCEDAAVAGEKKAVEEGENITLPIIMQRLVKVTLRRHHRPTSALRMEANLLVATRLLVGAACDDYPQTSRNALVLLKLLCHTFYTTTRRDGWRVEALELLTTLVSVCFSAVLGWSARNDIERHRPVPTRYYSDEDVAETTSHNKNRKLNCPNGLQNTTTKPDDIEDSESPYSPRISPEFIALLHETVFPFVQQLFTVTRSEFNFVSHRELFHFPCTPLSSLFEFGAVVLYLACVTFDAYTVLPSAVKAPCGYSCASHPLAQQSNGSHSMGNGRGIKRPRSATEAATNEGKIRVHSEAMYARAHPSAVILQLFHKHFFLESGGGSHSSAVEMARDVSSGELGSTNAVGDASGGGNQLLGAGRVADSVEGSIVGVVVHNDARESALLMLHLLAQPCATLGFTEEQCTLLVERCIIPLFPYHGVRLESLLLAVLHVVGPRTSVACQQELFRWLVRGIYPRRRHSAMRKVAQRNKFTPFYRVFYNAG
ncbi:hypothetical protein ERJ75_001330400 [Trypanosoma vivax]|nr:hypothetical protein ERJ75_001330400 [Trypanosoma vivax]